VYLFGGHLELDFSDGKGGVKTLGAGSGTVENRMTPIQTHLVLQLLLPLSRLHIPRICDPAISLHQRGRAEVLVLVPPVTRATRRAARAEDAFIQTVELPAFFGALEKFLAVCGRVGVLQVGLDGFVLLVEEGKVGNEVFDDVHVRQWVDLACVPFGAVDPAQTGEGVLAVNVHRAGPANAFSAGPAEGQSRVYLVLYLDQSIEKHRPCLVQVDGVRLECGFILRFIWIPAVYFELFMVDWLLRYRFSL